MKTGFRHAIIVPAAIVAACNQAAHAVGIDPACELNTLSCALVPDDGADDVAATHYAASGCITEAQRLALETGFQGGLYPGAMWWRWDDQTGALLASHDGLHLGEDWGWTQSLAAAGLQVRKISPP